jgi:L-fuconolactonase
MMTPGTQEWLDQVMEEILEPDLEIIDPHHHLWPEGGPMAYGLTDLEADLRSGHNVVGTVFVECGAAYERGGDDPMAPVDETKFVAAQAALASRPGIVGIVGTADLRRVDVLDDVLDAHIEAGGGLFKGIRHSLAHARHPESLTIPGRAPQGLAQDPAFRAGLTRLGERGLTYDSWLYHYQALEFRDAARAVPGTTFVLDHFSTPLGVGPFAGQAEEIFSQWHSDIAEIAACENVVAKLGGLAMPDNGFGWHTAPQPATSDEFVAAQRRYYERTIEVFGPERCMFESNFPVDRFSLSYPVVWNGFKKMTQGFSPTERAAMFSGTARRVYRLSV